MTGFSNSLKSGALQARNSDACAKRVHQRRAALQVLAVELKQLALTLQDVRSQIEGSQCYLRLIVPRPLLEQHLALMSQHQACEIEGTQGDAPDILLDVRTYVELDATKTALSQLLEKNQRFGMVVDIMAAALHLMEPATDALAQGFLQLHIKQCREVIKQVQETLEDFPRMRLRFFKQFQGPDCRH